MNYRAILEVSKQGDANTALLSMALVSSQWHQVTESSELWDSLSDLYHFPSRENLTAKEWFRQCCSFRCLPLQTPEGILLCQVPSLTTRKLPSEPPKNIDIATMICWVNPTTLLCCGGSLDLLSYEISTLTGKNRHVGNIHHERNWAGIIHFNHSTYILGGSWRSDYRTSAEKHSDQQWSLLSGTMRRGRNGFTPFEYSAQIYCVGRWDSVEVLDPVTESFTELQVKLPGSDFWSLSVTYDHYMVVVRGNAVLKYDLNTWDVLEQQPSKGFHGMWSNCPPVEYAGCFYSILNGNPQEGVLKLDVEFLTAENIHACRYTKFNG